MGTGRTYKRKPLTRPRKTGYELRRKQNVHKKRLIALGVSEEAIRTMTQKDIRELLKRPGKITASKAG